MPNKGRKQRRKGNGVPRKPMHSPLREANVMSGFPRQTRIKLTYATNIKMIGAAGVMNAVTAYRANGAYDPDVATGGTTPFNYGVWKKLYNHYIVMSSRITFRIGHTGCETAVTSGIYLADDTVALPYTTPGELIGARRGTYKVLPHIITTSAMQTHGAYNPKVFYSLKDPEDNSALTAPTNGLPSDQAIFFVWGFSTLAFRMEGIVEIVYDVLFKEPQDVSQ